MQRHTIILAGLALLLRGRGGGPAEEGRRRSGAGGQGDRDELGDGGA